MISDVVEAAIRDCLDDRGGAVREWPEDEKAAYRDNKHRSFEEARAAVLEVRFQKAVAVIDAALREAAASGVYALQTEADIEWGTATKWGPRANISKENALDYMELCNRCGDDVKLIKRRAGIDPGPWEEVE